MQQSNSKEEEQSQEKKEELTQHIDEVSSVKKGF